VNDVDWNARKWWNNLLTAELRIVLDVSKIAAALIGDSWAVLAERACRPLAQEDTADGVGFSWTVTFFNIPISRARVDDWLWCFVTEQHKRKQKIDMINR
jgi:hypothetical protein